MSKGNDKFELTNETIVVNRHILHRIRALKNLNGRTNHPVKIGDLGGYVEGEENLSRDGNSWIYDYACVYNRARVFGDAAVFDNAVVAGNAKIYGHATVFNDVVVAGDAEIYDQAIIFGDALIHGNTKVFGRAIVYDYACLLGNSIVCDDAAVFGEVRARDVTFSGNAKIDSYEEY